MEFRNQGPEEFKRTWIPRTKGSLQGSKGFSNSNYQEGYRRTLKNLCNKSTNSNFNGLNWLQMNLNNLNWPQKKKSCTFIWCFRVNCYELDSTLQNDLRTQVSLGDAKNVYTRSLRYGPTSIEIEQSKLLANSLWECLSS